MKIELDKINQAYDRLPESLKEVFDSKDTSDALMNIGKKYGLHIDQLGGLTSLVHYVLLGFLTPRDFPRELKSSVGVPEDVANLIIYDLNQQILSKIRSELENLSDKRNNPETTHTVTASAPQVFDQKMQSVANVPKQEVAVTPQTGDNKVRDPYREPI